MKNLVPVAVTATIIGSNGAPYAYGSYQIQLVDSNGNTVVSRDGVTMPVFTGVLTSAGSLAASLYPNNTITLASGTTATFWKFSVRSAPSNSPQYLFSYQQSYSALVTITAAGDYSVAASVGAPALYYQDEKTGNAYFNNVSAAGTTATAVGSFSSIGLIATNTATITPATMGAARAITLADPGGAATIAYTNPTTAQTWSGANNFSSLGLTATNIATITPATMAAARAITLADPGGAATLAYINSTNTQTWNGYNIFATAKISGQSLNTVTKTNSYQAGITDDVILWNGAMDGSAGITFDTTNAPVGKIWTVKVIQPTGAGPLNINTGNAAEWAGNPQIWTKPGGTATGGVATVQWNGTALWLLNYIQ